MVGEPPTAGGGEEGGIVADLGVVNGDGGKELGVQLELDTQAKAARLYCENFTHRECMVKELRYSLDEWPRSFIELPRPVNGSTDITAPVVSYRQQGNSTFTTFGSTN